jgi:hypothetical protein
MSGLMNSLAGAGPLAGRDSLTMPHEHRGDERRFADAGRPHDHQRRVAGSRQASSGRRFDHLERMMHEPGGGRGKLGPSARLLAGGGHAGGGHGGTGHRSVPRRNIAASVPNKS